MIITERVDITEQAALQIEEIRSSGQQERYRQVKIHRTEISRYNLEMVYVQDVTKMPPPQSGLPAPTAVHR